MQRDTSIKFKMLLIKQKMSNKLQLIIENKENDKQVVISGETFLNQSLNDQYVQDALIGAVNFINIRFENIDFTASTFTNCNFENCTFKNVCFRKCDFWNLIFKNCHLEMSELTRTNFHTSSFEKCSFFNVNLRASNFSEFNFIDTKFNNSNLELVSGLSIKIYKNNQWIEIKHSSSLKEFLVDLD